MCKHEFDYLFLVSKILPFEMGLTLQLLHHLTCLASDKRRYHCLHLLCLQHRSRCFCWLVTRIRNDPLHILMSFFNGKTRLATRFFGVLDALAKSKMSFLNYSSKFYLFPKMSLVRYYTKDGW